ncbi:eukaryotic translation initiation factor 3 subunit A-like [Molothrus ater]|uniref:eukaryotic translation initiation factor 3 subunit A-like n=1 Tax=Molothrus ater TaxID=84834 RepID=UPI00174B8961|nr:eukaryotic translation initiation factor 3 subunit A-like [Molothrus ater]
MPQRFCKSLPDRTPELPRVFAGLRKGAKGPRSRFYPPPSTLTPAAGGAHRRSPAQGAHGTSPPAAGERGGNGGAVGSRTSPARMPLTAPRRDAEM